MISKITSASPDGPKTEQTQIISKLATVFRMKSGRISEFCGVISDVWFKVVIKLNQGYFKAVFLSLLLHYILLLVTVKSTRLGS